MAHFEVIKPGVLSLIQDAGRIGFQHLGLTNGGPMDEHAARWANYLLGNPVQAPLVEISVGQFSVRASADADIALTGADLNARLNEQPVQPWQTLHIRRGDILSFGYPRHGLRAYLAVKGGFVLEPQFNSCATVVREGMGGLNGLALQQGDQLAFTASSAEPKRSVPHRYQPDYTRPLTLRVLAAYQHDDFSEQARNTFYQQVYTLSPHSDRMGARLKGPAIEWQAGGLISEGISLGAVQVPPDGQPIILLQDRQTIGGYPKIGTVLPQDLWALSQRQPGTQLRFAAASLHSASRKLAEIYRFFSSESCK